MQPNLVLFPDTNIFIEAKDLKDLLWKELASQEIRLMVCPTVLEEIDEHKTPPKNRVKDRARKWNSEFKKLLNPDAIPLVLKQSSPRVTLEILKVSAVGPTQGTLDLTKPDNQLIDWTLRYRESNASEDVRVLTDDTGPLGKAYSIGCPVIDMPAHWRPEPGPSKEQKEIDTLKQKLKLYQDNCPRPVITILDDQGSELKDLKHKASPYRNLRSDEIDALVDELRSSDPPVEAEKLKSLHSSRGPTSFGMWIPPTDERISKYLHEDYPAWIDKTREVLWGLGTK
jgi:PIN domain-containing protein